VIREEAKCNSQQLAEMYGGVWLAMVEVLAELQQQFICAPCSPRDPLHSVSLFPVSDPSAYRPMVPNISSNIVTICNVCHKVLPPPGAAPHTTTEVNTSLPEWVDMVDFQQRQVDLQHLTWSHGLCDKCYRAEMLVLENADAILSSSPHPSVCSAPPLLSDSDSENCIAPVIKKILVVDDNELQRKIVKRMTERQGYQCDVASTGSEAVAMAKSNSYAVILMDCMMSGTDGWATSTIIRNTECKEDRALIVALTGLKPADDLLAKCKEAGMDEVVQKPLTNSALQRIMSK